MHFGLPIRWLPPKEIVGMLPETLQVDDSGEVGISKMFSYASSTSISWLRNICQHDALRQGRVSTARTFRLVELVRLAA